MNMDVTQFAFFVFRCLKYAQELKQMAFVIEDTTTFSHFIAKSPDFP